MSDISGNQRTERRALLQQLESLRLAGVQFIPDLAPTAKEGDAAMGGPVTTRQLVATGPPAVEGTPGAMPPVEESRKDVRPPSNTRPPTMSRSEHESQLQPIAAEVAACTRCEELARQRNKTVFGVGNPQARLCFLGEGPGADEDRTGEPFVGRAGQLLTKIIEACTLTRDEVYILNVVKCRPPGNRNPTSAEAENCRGFLERQLAVIQPEYICCLGSVAASNLLDTKLAIGKLRGKLHDWRGIKVLATYHPAYLLRNPSAKADVWQDMQLLMHDMGLQRPAT